MLLKIDVHSILNFVDQLNSKIFEKWFLTNMNAPHHLTTSGYVAVPPADGRVLGHAPRRLAGVGVTAVVLVLGQLVVVVGVWGVRIPHLTGQAGHRVTHGPDIITTVRGVGTLCCVCSKKREEWVDSFI